MTHLCCEVIYVSEMREMVTSETVAKAVLGPALQAALLLSGKPYSAEVGGSNGATWFCER